MTKIKCTQSKSLHTTKLKADKSFEKKHLLKCHKLLSSIWRDFYDSDRKIMLSLVNTLGAAVGKPEEEDDDDMY